MVFCSGGSSDSKQQVCRPYTFGCMQAREAVVYLLKKAQHYREPDPAAIQADGISGTALPSSLVECLHARSPGSLSHVWAAGV